MPSNARLTRFGGLAVASALALAGVSATAKDDPAVAASVIALAKAQWAAETAGATPADQLSSVADDYTEFNAQYPTLLVGKAMAQRMAAVPLDIKPAFSDMQNPHVQVYGDTAILTYNFAGMTRATDGKIMPSLAKSTRVYVRNAGKWLLVHANFAPIRGPDQ